MKEYIPGVLGGIVLTGSGIAIFALGYDLPIYASVTLSAVLGVSGVIVAAGKSLQKAAGWVYVIIVAARSGTQVEHLPKGLETEPVNHPEIPENSNGQGLPDSSKPPEVKP